MRNLFGKKAIAIVLVLLLVSTTGALVYADNLAKQITAIQNGAIKIQVNKQILDLTDDDGLAMDPIIYNGHSYVPAKALAEALGGNVSWNEATSTVVVSTEYAGALPVKDNTTKKPAAAPSTPVKPDTPAPTPAPAKPTTSSSSAPTGNKGGVSDPVALGTTFTYTDLYNYKEGINDSTSGTYAVTVNGTTPITPEEIAALGFKKPSDDPLTEFALVDVTVKASNLTINKGSDPSNSGYEYMSSMFPDIWGTKVFGSKGGGIIGYQESGFDGSIMNNFKDKYTDFPKVNPGDSKSYEVSGKILITVYKNQENLLTLRKRDTNLEYENSFIAFRIK
ncbi:copper amine oxidase N-terminal domain-containing protein [Paenibacillus sp. WQ 127069]|uniref:Copper amine oxidase N-terminal domain-containing protein n=1 Tax=Paenibacillus baimaensis TaxID=2982185 RepID=A0ABT2UHF3_9BACL|nr:copper amine oxidase N-terminal domain-containing protein [Paenibacillus sp. WQ 127069]MCU6794035.1 copper amine oxidase N-terminal domain-containing protein [Paenibacillus sp. WQ 127069]